MINGINHITIAVDDLTTAFAFYVKVLEMTPHAKWDKGAYLSLHGLWFCLSVDNRKPSDNYGHIAFDVAETDFEAVKQRIVASKAKLWKDNKSEGQSLYFLDPSGNKLELHVGNLQTRLASLGTNPYKGLELF